MNTPAVVVPTLEGLVTLAAPFAFLFLLLAVGWMLERAWTDPGEER